MAELSPERIAKRQCQLAFEIEIHSTMARERHVEHNQDTCLYCSPLQELLEALNTLATTHKALEEAQAQNDKLANAYVRSLHDVHDATARAERAEAELKRAYEHCTSVNTQIFEIENAIVEILGPDAEWDGLGETVKLIGSALTAARQEAAERKGEASKLQASLDGAHLETIRIFNRATDERRTLREKVMEMILPVYIRKRIISLIDSLGKDGPVYKDSLPAELSGPVVAVEVAESAVDALRRQRSS